MACRPRWAALVVAAFAVGWLDPFGAIYWALAARELPRIKQRSLAEASPFESVSRDRWIAASERAFMIEDLEPQAPVHLLVVAKQRVPSVLEAPPDLLGEMLALARNTARTRGIADDGFRVVINTNPRGAQTVYHLHMHVLGGRQMRWPPN